MSPMVHEQYKESAKPGFQWTARLLLLLHGQSTTTQLLCHSPMTPPQQHPVSSYTHAPSVCDTCLSHVLRSFTSTSSSLHTLDLSELPCFPHAPNVSRSLSPTGLVASFHFPYIFILYTLFSMTDDQEMAGSAAYLKWDLCWVGQPSALKLWISWLSLSGITS